MKCPSCNGEKAAIAHINTGPDSSKHRLEEVACRTCGGSGEITDEHADRIALGKKMRDNRRESGLSLYDAAKALRMTSAELSAIEHGRLPFNSKVKGAE